MFRVIPAVILVAVSNGLLVRADSATSKEARAAAAKGRQEATLSVEVVFKLSELWPKGSVNKLASNQMEYSGLIPKEDTTLESVNRLVIDGNRVRYEDNHPLWSTARPQPSQGHHIRIHVRGQRSFLPSKGVSGDAPPTGVIDHPGVAVELRRWNVAPLIMAFRGDDRVLSRILVRELQETGRSLPIDGTTCDEYTRPHGEGTDIVWLDTANRHLIRRISTVTKKGTLRNKCDIRYRREGNGTWVPAGWTRTGYSTKGEIILTMTAEVQTVLFAPPIDAATFDSLLPPETKVYDNREQKTYKVETPGTMREFDRKTSRLGRTVNQPNAPWYRQYHWTLVASLAVGILLASSWFIRRARVRRP
ncbi:MAG: hypothetical protein U0746_05325 [Gemmataceae bacterium]